MQKLILFFSIILVSLSLKAQEQKVEIVPDSLFHLKSTSTEQTVKWSCGYSVIGIPILIESVELNNHYDLYTHLSKAPGVLISSNPNLNIVPTIRMRGDDNTIVIVDGIRYDASILNTLNPSNIESITVAPSVAASNYLLNN